MNMDNRIRRAVFFGVFLLVFAAAAVIAHLAGGLKFVAESAMAPDRAPATETIVLDAGGGKEGVCMGVPILDGELTAKYRSRDYSRALCFSGVAVPMDEAQNVIYLPQSIDADTVYTGLQGELTVSLDRCRLYFAADEAFLDLDAAVAEGHGFRLLVVDERAGEYMEYRVVLTTLPVLYIDGGLTHFDRDGEDTYTGQMHLLNPMDVEEQGYTIKSSCASWHLRGATTARQPKKSWKLNLIDDRRENAYLSLLGLGVDDDWILNSMSLDDSRVKEKLAMDVWNTMAAETPENDNMSTGEYVELVRNGSYGGIYLLQRRIDEGYLELGHSDLLFKGKNAWEIRTLEDGYELEYSELSLSESYDLIEGWATQTDCSIADVDNFIRVNLFLQWGSMGDSISYNNIYYVLQKQAEGYRMYMVPWDTDYSMGVLWYDEFFSYQQDMSVTMIADRVEYGAMKRLHPDLERQMAEQWFALREGVFSRDFLLGLLDEYEALLNGSGALGRDRALWGEFYGGQDSVDSLKRFFSRRMEILDERYEKILK